MTAKTATTNESQDNPMSKTTTSALVHRDGCKGDRTETTDYPGRGIATARCVDCGAHAATDRSGNTLATPAVTGGLNGAGRGDMDITMERMGGAA